MSKKDWRLLEAYKATGLSPEQIVKLKEAHMVVTEVRQNASNPRK